MTAAVLERLEELRPALDAHAGGVELVEVDRGVVRLRFTGMCTGCPLRPLTTASTIRPALLSLEGVEAVEIEGSRISAEAEARLAAAFAGVERSQGWPSSA
jgi:Fe-S cluster biogenesis protein NfuA